MGKITVKRVTDKMVTIRADEEVWVQVLSNQLYDLPRARAAMDADQLAELDACYPDPIAYYPSLEPSEEGYKYEDWFIFKRKAH